MQEALKKLKLEEEKRRLEEEAKLKAAEEAERLRLLKVLHKFVLNMKRIYVLAHMNTIFWTLAAIRKRKKREEKAKRKRA